MSRNAHLSIAIAAAVMYKSSRWSIRYTSWLIGIPFILKEV